MQQRKMLYKDKNLGKRTPVNRVVFAYNLAKSIQERQGKGEDVEFNIQETKLVDQDLYLEENKARTYEALENFKVDILEKECEEEEREDLSERIHNTCTEIDNKVIQFYKLRNRQKRYVIKQIKDSYLDGKFSYGELFADGVKREHIAELVVLERICHMYQDEFKEEERVTRERYKKSKNVDDKNVDDIVLANNHYLLMRISVVGLDGNRQKEETLINRVIADKNQFMQYHKFDEFSSKIEECRNEIRRLVHQIDMLMVTKGEEVMKKREEEKKEEEKKVDQDSNDSVEGGSDDEVNSSE